MWQDTLLAVVAVVFFLALIPSILDPATRISRRTSVPTAIGVWIQMATFASLGLAFATLATLAIALAWTQLAIWRAPR